MNLFCATWGGQKGSLLFWAGSLGVMAWIALANSRKNLKALVPAMTATLALIELFFCILMIFSAPPFETLSHPPSDGHGLNPIRVDLGQLLDPVENAR